MSKDATPLSYLQELELLRVRSSAGVVPESVTLETVEGREVLSFDLQTEVSVEPPKADIRDVERVHFLYHSGCKFGLTAPMNVICERPDFPRNVGHLCSGPPGCPAAPCLAIGGIQPVYEHAGIEALMERLRAFMRDAKTGSLMADGWEPVPFGLEQRYRAGQINPAFFQNYAAAHPGENSVLGVAVNVDDGEVQFVRLVSQAIAIGEIRNAIAFRHESNRLRGIPWVFLWPDRGNIEHDPIFEDWKTVAQLRAGLDRIGVLPQYDAATGNLLVEGCDFKHHHPEGRKSVVLVLGVWRPAPLMGAFFGYSDDPAARSLELRAYIVSNKITRRVIDDDAQVEAIVADYPPEPSLLRWVSGVAPIPPIALMGYGALGSAIFNNLARAGAGDVVVQDSDLLKPHNLARHAGGIDDLYKAKAAHAKVLADHVSIDGAQGQVELHREDIVKLDLATLAARTQNRLIIDATADERVRLKMDELRGASGDVIIRTEIFHEGRLGAIFVSLPGGPTFSDLALVMAASAASDPAIAAWLEDEARHPLGPDPLLCGFGCASQTVHLPNYVVEQHASATMTSILEERPSSGIGLNPLDEQFRPLGWRWTPVEPFMVLTPPTHPDWAVRISADALNVLKDERAAALPSETGGYLYGGWDPARKTITIVYASSLPPDSKTGPTTLALGSAGKTPGEERLRRKSRERVFLCGSWHSHPNGSAAMSGRDYKTLMTHHEADAPGLRPTLIVIVADDDIQAHLKV